MTKKTNVGRTDLIGLPLFEDDTVSVSAGKDSEIYIIQVVDGEVFLVNDSEVIELSFFDDKDIKKLF